MRIRILTPTEVALEEAASKVVAESLDGSFCLLPRHLDYAAALVPPLANCSWSFHTTVVLPFGRNTFHKNQKYHLFCLFVKFVSF